MAADFLARSLPKRSLVTVTHAELTADLKTATIFLTVLPQTEEQDALKEAKRMRSDLRDYLRSHTRLHPLPVVDFDIDYGEKNRQRIDELTRN